MDTAQRGIIDAFNSVSKTDIVGTVRWLNSSYNNNDINNNDISSSSSSSQPIGYLIDYISQPLI